jgi:flagellar biosynthesis protein FlhB
MADDKPAGEKTEEPTPRRLAEARRKGEVAKSRDLTGAVVFVAVFGVGAVGAGGALGRLVSYLAHVMEAAGRGSGQDVTGALALAVGQSAALLALPLGLAALAAALIGAVQTGGVFSTEPFKLKPEQVLPQLKRVVSVGALAEVGKGLLKVTLVTVVAWWTMRPLLRPMAMLPGARVAAVLTTLGVMAQALTLRLAVASIAIGALDYMWQRHQHHKQQRMTRDEVKREHKESEGDPHHKAERGRLHREIAEQQMLQDVRKADFVVVNPDHIAVALRYDRDGEGAPIVVAKGERLVAESIKDVAREAGVPIFRDVTLARSLRELEAGDEIPEALYEAVAEILRVVYGTSLPAGAGAGEAAEGAGGEGAAGAERPAAAGAEWRRV